VARLGRATTDARLPCNGLPGSRCRGGARWRCCRSCSHYHNASANRVPGSVHRTGKRKCPRKSLPRCPPPRPVCGERIEVRGCSKLGLRKGALTEFRIPHLSPLPLRKGEANLAVSSSLGSLSELDPCYGLAGTLGGTGTGNTIPPRPVAGRGLR